MESELGRLTATSDRCSRHEHSRQTRDIELTPSCGAYVGKLGK